MTHNSSVTPTFYVIILPLIYGSEGVRMDGCEGYERKAVDFRRGFEFRVVHGVERTADNETERMTSLNAEDSK